MKRIDKKYKVCPEELKSIISSENPSICRTCWASIKRGVIPAQAEINNLYVVEIPPALKKLNWIESLFIKRIRYMQVIFKTRV